MSPPKVEPLVAPKPSPAQARLANLDDIIAARAALTRIGKRSPELGAALARAHSALSAVVDAAEALGGGP